MTDYVFADDDTDSNPKKVLVTGASGFVGRHLVEALVYSGYEVTAMVRQNSPGQEHLTSLGVTLVHADVTNVGQLQGISDTLAKVDVIYHVAGKITAYNQGEFDSVNVVGTRNLLEVCKSSGNRPAIVLVSSLAAAGPASSPTSVLTEADVASPVSNYGKSKFGAEEVAYEFARYFDITIVRPPIVFGERDKVSLELVNSIRRFPWVHAIPGNRKRLFSFVYIEDLVQALMLAAEKGERISRTGESGQGIYYVATGEPVTYGQFGQIIKQALGQRFLLPVSVPGWLISAAGRCMDLYRSMGSNTPHIVNRDKGREASVKGAWACDTSKLQGLGFRSGTLQDSATQWVRSSVNN